MRPQGPAPGLLYAHFGWRLLAHVIDGLITAIPNGFIFVIAFISALPQLQTIFDAVGQGTASSGLSGAVIGSVVKIFLVPFLLSLMVSFIYSVVIVTWLSATVGMKALGLSIVNVADGSRIQFVTALTRWLVALGFSVGGSFLSFVVPFGFVLGWIDAFWCIWDDRKQTLHDKVVHTFVVKPV
jgi:uncharacterized RDD family membrane protein YckC